MATRQLATWISSLTYSDIPDNVIKAALRSFHNSLGCIIGGASHPTVQRAVEANLGTSNGTCTCIGQSGCTEYRGGFWTTLEKGIFINGIASHVHDYDDTHLRTVIHPAGAIVVSLMGYAEHLERLAKPSREVTGKEFITALVVGIETSLRLGNAISPNHYSAGWHITGTVSPLGVAAAISNLEQLDVDTTVAALGIASTQPVGLRVHFGTDTKAIHVGRAAQIGIEAVRLARAGLTAAPDSLEGKRGWVEILGHGANHLDEQIAELTTLTEQARSGSSNSAVGNTPWEIEKNTFKPFPCGIVIHPIIDACIQARTQHNLMESGKLKAIQQVSLRVNPLVLDLTGKRTPKDGLEAKFSVYHGAAIGLLFGTATPADYDDKVVVDPEVISLRDKVIAEADDAVRSDEAFLRITVDGGDDIKWHVEHAIGSLDRPMTDAELREKFLNQVEPILGRKKAVEADRQVWDILSLYDFRIMRAIQ